MKPGAGRFVLREHQPTKVWATRIAVTLAVIVALLATWHLAYRRGGSDNTSLRAERDLLRGELDTAQAELSSLREHVAILERAGQISNDADVRTLRALAERDRQIADLRAELVFYESLVASGGGVEGLQIHSLEMRFAGDEVWEFLLTLTHDAREAPDAAGRAFLSVEGLGNGELIELSWPELGAANPEAGLEYAFKYFQVVRGDILIPAGFVPRRVRVQLVPADAKAKEVERSFDWPEIERKGETANVQ